MGADWGANKAPAEELLWEETRRAAVGSAKISAVGSAKGSAGDSTLEATE